jgi:peptide/nickel transport system permease protein
MVVLAVLLFTALTADVISPYDPVKFQDADVLEPPSLAHLLGTDQLARDTLSRVIHGARVSVQAGVGAVGFALVVGVAIGLLAGYYGGRTDDVLMRLIDGFYAFPLLLLALAIAYSLGPGLNNTLLAIGIGFTPHFARLTRGQTLSVREREFVAAARVTGAPPWRIMVYHIWPNVTAAIIVQASLLVGQAIIPVWPEPASRPAVGPRHWSVYRPYPADGCAASPRSCRVPARSYRTGSRPL